MSLAQFLNELILFLFIYGFLNIFSFINMRATVFYSVPFLILTILLIEFHGNSLIFILIPGRWNHLPSPIILFPTMVDKLQKSVKKSPILHTSLCLCPLQYDCSFSHPEMESGDLFWPTEWSGRDNTSHWVLHTSLSFLEHCYCHLYSLA